MSDHSWGKKNGVGIEEKNNVIVDLFASFEKSIGLLLKIHFFGLAALAVMALAVAGPVFAGRQVTVGVYQNEPKVFMDSQGAPSGIFIDLIREIAKKEGWDLHFQSGTWDEGLNALESGSIDLMPDVAYSTERDQKFDFHMTPVVDSWSYVYVPSGRRADNLSQLEGMRVAVLKGSIQETFFNQITAGLGIHVSIVPTTSLTEAFKTVSDGRADAAISNHLFGDYFNQQYNLVRTPIVFNAAKLYFATGQGRNTDLLGTIDRRLNEWKAKHDSIYYQILNRYTTHQSILGIPAFVFWVLSVVLGLLVFASGIILLLRWQVGQQTRSLTQINKRLRESESKYRDLVQNANSIILYWSSDGRILFINEFGQEFFGYSESELLGRQVVGTLVPETESGGRDLRRLVDDIRANPKAFEHNINENVRRNGERVWISWSNKVSLDKHGKPTEILSVGTDITAQRKAEEQVRQNELRYRTLFESSSDAILLMKDGRFVDCNARSSLVFGCPRDQIIGESLFRFSHLTQPGGRSSKDLAFEKIQLAMTQGPQLFEWEHCRANGAPFTAEVSLNRMDLGSETLIQVVVRDITDRKKAEETKNQFLNTTSHELKTPLIPIKSQCQILLDEDYGPLNPKQRDAIDMIHKNENHLEQLVNDILDIAKSRSDRLQIQFEKTDFGELVRDSLANFMDWSKKAGVSLSAQIPAKLPPVYVSPNRMKRVIDNLLSNAIKNTPKKGTVTLSVAADKDSLTVTVRDTGIGMSRLTLKKLFTPFFQADAGLDRKHGGTGLGLSICKEFIEAHGGRIWGESEGKNKGSLFTFIIPIGIGR